MKPIDPFKKVARIKSPLVRNKILDTVFTQFIPFNRGLGLTIHEASKQRVIVFFKNKRRRKNHVGTTHAVALALLGEYTAGLLIAQNFSFEKYRIIISDLTVKYHKPGVGILRSEASAPASWPEFHEGEAWVEFTIPVLNEKDQLVCEVTTKWQIKEWGRTKMNRAPF